MAQSQKVSNKTPAIMRLITGESAQNPILSSEFKEEVIKPRSSVSERALKNAEIEKYRKIAVEIDVGAELVSELMPKVLQRFNCCTCHGCFADAMAEALDSAPELKIKVRDSKDLREADKLKKRNHHQILMKLVRVAIARRNLPIHPDNPQI